MPEVGDAIELTYSTTPGATVTVSWADPTGTAVLTAIPVAESTSVPGDYPYTFVGTAPGTWRATFAATGTAVQSDTYEVAYELVAGPLPLATVGEYAAIYGALTAARTATCKALLRRASALVRGAYPGIDARITAGDADGVLIGQVVLNMASRVLRNPAGLRTETTGPFSRGYDPEAASGLLTLTGDDRDLLLSAGAGGGTARRKGRTGTVRVAGGMVPPPRRRPRHWHAPSDGWHGSHSPGCW